MALLYTYSVEDKSHVQLDISIYQVEHELREISYLQVTVYYFCLLYKWHYKLQSFKQFFKDFPKIFENSLNTV